MTSTALEIDDLVVDYTTRHGTIRALDGASLSVESGQTIAIVGESGSGKSTLGSVVGRLLPRNASITRGSVRVGGTELRTLSNREIVAVRRTALGFIPQDPIGSLDPTLRIGRQMALVLRQLGRPSTTADLEHHLESVKLRDPQRVLRSYPSQISGGMAQRVAVAMAMARQPRVLIADEPTAALDAQVREEVLTLIFSLAAENGTAVLWLSHDLAAVSRWCSKVAVMYGGRVVEEGPSSAVLTLPSHPYTAALVSAIPGTVGDGVRLKSIPGSPPILTGAATGCAFAGRCDHADNSCFEIRPEAIDIGAQRSLCLHSNRLRDEHELVGTASVSDDRRESSR
ncbi:ABC transporter ATP-binding protein [Rhodococcus qingshengii]|uniref:ABC transporter ATP-binding protein n=1 Tax=Rhodococcus qingshengii TaxID=334542 RepID=UPI0036DA428C